MSEDQAIRPRTGTYLKSHLKSLFQCVKGCIIMVHLEAVLFQYKDLEARKGEPAQT